ncbi:MAG: sialidase family protein [Chloroflexi bacterium]|nr:sialidase family protein [Chloroflexota bacterium]
MSHEKKSLVAVHGIVCHLPQSSRGYFGWPSVTQMDDGSLVVVSSGLREWHICPWGKTVMNISCDDGASWSQPQVIRDTPIDDRDAGVISLGGAKLLVSMFSSDPRPFEHETAADAHMRAGWHDHLTQLYDDEVAAHAGSWILLSEDAGKSWSDPIAAPVSAPHGPIRLASGRLLYFGKDARDLSTAGILCAVSDDDGCTWRVLGEVPLPAGTTSANYHEPHVVELPGGRLVGLIRIENAAPVVDLEANGFPHFGIMQTESDDGGATWTTARTTVVRHGSPPHLIRHSSGTLVCVYSFRQHPFGQRAMLSYDDGKTWVHDFVIRDDGPTWDLGYPASVELADGSIFTVYYQQVRVEEPCALLWSRWRLPL